MATVGIIGYEILVANFSRPFPSLISGADPVHDAPTKVRTGFEFTHIQTLGFTTDHTQAGAARSVVVSTLQQEYEPALPTGLPTADLVVADNVFAGLSATIHLGPYELVSNRDFVPGAGVNATATAIGAAIDNLPGYSTIVAAATVTVSGPRGQVGLPFFASYTGGNENFTFTYPAGSQEFILGYGPTPADGPIKPPHIFPPGLPNGVAP